MKNFNMKYIITERQQRILEKTINEQFDSERLYPKDEIIKLLKGAPRELKNIAKNLPNIPCENDNGVKTICTKIPETIHVYLTGRY